MEKIPIIINNFNLLTYPKEMVRALLDWDDVGEIFIVDNNSSYRPLLEWYNLIRSHKRVNVLKCNSNFGHVAPWAMELPKQLTREFKCRYFVVTDPDLDLSGCPIDTLSRMIDAYKTLPYGSYDYQARAGDPFSGAKILYRLKIGLGIRIDDVPPDALFYTEMETRYYEQPMHGDLVRLAPVDTTFALYDSMYGVRAGIGGVRMEEPYQVRHLPYYFTGETLKQNYEYQNYLSTANYSSSTKQRFDGIGSTNIEK